MNKKDIMIELKKAKYNEFSCSIFSELIYEFQKLFKEKYISTMEVVKRITKNIKKGIVIYDEADDVFDATCSITASEFKVNREVINNKEYFSYVLFHEMIHAISYKKFPRHKFFMGFYSEDYGDEYAYKSQAFNEAFTEYLAIKRNNMIGYNVEEALSGYDLGVQKVAMIVKAIPEDELIDIYFNHPYDLEKALIKYNMNMEDIFYATYLLEDKQISQRMLEQKRGLDNPNEALRIIEANRIMLFNISNALGKPANYMEFKKKWSVILSERDMKYNYIFTDGLGYFMEFFFDLFDLNLKKEQMDKLITDLKIKKTTIKKYKKLSEIFSKESKYGILQELAKVYQNDYNKYFDIIKDDVAPLCYRFFYNIPNNYFLYDIELYPRVIKYINEKDDFDKIKFKKIICEEDGTKFYVFLIGKNRIIECTYNNVYVEQEEKNRYKVIYEDESYNYIIYEKGKYYYDLQKERIELKYIY